MYPTISQLSLGDLHELLVKLVFFSNVQVRNLEDSLFFFTYLFQQSQACVGSIPESQLKSKTSHSLIHMGFIGLVMWSGVRGLWKKGSERLKEYLKVILSKNLKSVAFNLFISTFGLGSIPFVLYINPYCTFVPSL